MQVVEKKIGDISPYENNPRRNESAVDYVAESLKEFGFQQPIVVDKNNVIIVGHTRYEAAKKLGYKTVPVVIASELTEKQAKAYRIADNKTNDFSVWDNKRLLEELDGLDDIFTGFEDGGTFADILSESDSDVILGNEGGGEV